MVLTVAVLALILATTARPLAVLGVRAATRPAHPSQAGFRPADRSAGTDEQLEWLVAEFGAVLFKVAFAVTRSTALAEEVVQDSLFQAWTAMPSWEGDVPIKWMRRVTRNRAISVMRKEQRSGAELEWEFRESTDPETERVVEGRHAMSAVEAALRELDEDARVMLVLRETEGTSYEDLAELLEMTPSAIKAKLYRSRHTLKTQLKDWDL